jgi:hypothetical protein
MEGKTEEMEGFREEMEGFREEMEGLGMGKNVPPYYCSICNINCHKKNHYEIHEKTKKHINNFKLQMQIHQTETINGYKCKYCGKTYKTDSGLWKHTHKFHKKINPSEESQETENEYNEHDNYNTPINPPPIQNIITPELVLMLIQQNKDMQQMMMDKAQSMMLEQNKTMMEQSKNMMESIMILAKSVTTTNNNTNTNVQNNNNNNKSFNLNVFLNETCKDAMNMSDFLERLDVTTYDFEHTGKNGYVEGMCRILENGLNQLEVHERPIHCTDAKRETIYIKDNDKWEKDDDKKTKLVGVIKQVGAKNIKMIPQWCKEHPGWRDSDSKENDRYLKYVFNSMCGGTDEEIHKNYGDIARYISKLTVVDKKEAIEL